MEKSVSFILPAFNEEDGISETLSSISRIQIKLPYEIIVVDHASSDKTAEIAAALGAHVVSAKGGTIAGVRNMGVSHSNGELIVFLDADVSLTERWSEAFGRVCDALSEDPMIVTGSHCNAPVQGNWIERYWFNNLTHEVRVTHLGTGHMIVTRELFDKVDGFDSELETGEDYAFCMQVKNIGGQVINNPELYVIHRDYPKNIWAFIKREAWHGMGDVLSIRSVLASKVAMASLLFIGLHLLLVAVFLSSVPELFVFFPVAALAALLLFSSWKKFSHSYLNVVLVNSVVFYFYFFGRSLSLFRRIFAVW